MDLKRLLGLTKADVEKIATDSANAAAAKAAAEAQSAATSIVANIAESLAAVRDLPPIVTDGLLVAAEHVFVGEGRPITDADLQVRGGVDGGITKYRSSGGTIFMSTSHLSLGSHEGGSGAPWPHKRYKVVVAFIPCPDDGADKSP